MHASSSYKLLTPKKKPKSAKPCLGAWWSNSLLNRSVTQQAAHAEHAKSPCMLATIPAAFSTGQLNRQRMQSMLAARTRTRKRTQTRSAGNGSAVAGAGRLAARRRWRSASVAVEGQHIVRRQVACSKEVTRSAISGYQPALSHCH